MQWGYWGHESMLRAGSRQWNFPGARTKKPGINAAL